MPTRAEHRRDTLRRLGEAAVELYERSAPHEPTVEEIADHAGVSRRTVFRYVEAREDLAFIHPYRWLEVFDVAVAEATGQAASARVRHGAAAICSVIDADPVPVRRAMAVVAANPSLAARVGVINRRWVERIAAELEENEVARFEALVVGAAVMGVIDAALAEWAPLAGERLGPIVARGLDYLEPILPH